MSMDYLHAKIYVIDFYAKFLKRYIQSCFLSTNSQVVLRLQPSCLPSSRCLHTGKGFQDAEPRDLHFSSSPSSSWQTWAALKPGQRFLNCQCAENKKTQCSVLNGTLIFSQSLPGLRYHTTGRKSQRLGGALWNATFREWHSFAIILIATVVTLHKTIPDQARQNPGIGGVDDLQVSPLNE